MILSHARLPVPPLGHMWHGVEDEVYSNRKGGKRGEMIPMPLQIIDTIGAPGGTRTRTAIGQRILSPLRLPIPPPGHDHQDAERVLLQSQTVRIFLLKICCARLIMAGGVGFEPTRHC